MIPRTLHYCWFGPAPLPDYALASIDSWRRLMPDFEIVRWSERNWDVDSNRFSAKNWRNGKYAFVSDVCRLDVLAAHGGIYLDTDVLAKKSLTPFLKFPSFLGMMYSDSVGTAVIGAMAGAPLISALRAAYDDDPSDDAPNNDLVTGRLLELYPEFVLGDHNQQLSDGTAVFDRHFFERYSADEDRGFTQHLVANSWHEKQGAADKTVLSRAKTSLPPATIERLGNIRTIPRAAHFASFVRHKATAKKPQCIRWDL